MSASLNTYKYNPSKLYRDRDHRLLGGVCAGIGNFFGVSRHAVRFLVVVSLFMFTLPTIIGYFAALVLLKYKPEDIQVEPEETEFWQSIHRSPADTMGTIRQRFSKMETRMRNLEAYLTSRKYKLDRAFDKMQD
ncbi:MAG: envelope stress response membrane protein PspC [Thermodesulfobacteriota bacterium]|nr:envelope stress response membrane protein PspC [Thermodesulfobacteriota bacterium]